MEISERVEELTNTLGSLCQDYHIPVNYSYPAAMPHHACLHHDTETGISSHDKEEEEEEFQKFCQHHTYLMNSTSHNHLGYSTLPLPPNRGGERKAIILSAPHPKRSQSYEGHHMRDYATLTFPSPRNSYPQSHENERSTYHKKPQFKLSFHGNYHPRPLSYQEISYDENDFEESSIDGSWSELSCP